MPHHHSPSRETSDHLHLARTRRCLLVVGADGPVERAIAEQLIVLEMEVHTAGSRPTNLPSVVGHMLPDPREAGFIPALARLVRRYGIELVIPANPAVLPPVSVGRPSIGADVLVAGAGPIATANDRVLTAWNLWSHGVAVPDFGVPSDFADAESALEIMGGQMAIRSRWASGRQPAVVVNASDELDWWAMSDDLFVQQFVPGTAYTVVVYRPVSGKGKLTAVFEESKRDRNVVGRVVPPREVVEVERLAQAAVRALGLTGPVEVNIRRRVDGSPVVLSVKACLGEHSVAIPELLDAVLRNNPGPPSPTVQRMGINGMAAAGLRPPAADERRTGALG